MPASVGPHAALPHQPAARLQAQRSRSSKPPEVCLPALSTHVPATDWLSPSFESRMGAVTEATPDSGSEQLNVTVTGLLVHVPGV